MIGNPKTLTSLNGEAATEAMAEDPSAAMEEEEEDPFASITFVEEKEDPFAWMSLLCIVSDSQKAILANCPMARQFEFAGSASSSPQASPTPSEIVLNSPPASPGSVSEEECLFAQVLSEK